MKKLLVFILMLFVLFALSACGSNDGGVDVATQNQQNDTDDTPSNIAVGYDDVLDDGQDAAYDGFVQMQSNTGYTFGFGDSFIWHNDRWALSISDDFFLHHDDRWEQPIIAIPVTITRRPGSTSGNPFQQHFHFNPGWPMENNIISQEHNRVLALFSMSGLIGYHEDVLPCFSSNPISGDWRLLAGESREHAIYMLYEGDGYYYIISGNWRGGDWADFPFVQLRFYISL